MKKALSVIALLLLFSFVMAQDVEAVRKVWNDGNIDYIPLGTEFSLEAEGLDPTVGSIIYSQNNSDPVEYTTPVALTEEGQLLVSWVTKDLWGNISNAKSYTGIVDGTAPEVKFLVNGPSFIDNDGVFYITKDTGIQFFAEDKLSGTEHLYASVNDGETIDVIDGTLINLADMEDGDSVANCIAVDYVGNVSEQFSTYFYLDNSAPVVNIDINVSPKEVDGVQYISPDTNFVISATDELSGVEGIYVSIDGNEFAKYDATQPLMITEAGDHTLQVYAKDNLGNTSSISEMAFATDLTLPPANLFLNVKNTQAVTTEAGAQDANTTDNGTGITATSETADIAK